MTDLQTTARVDWQDTFQDALGVAAPSGQLMRCAIEGFALPPPDDVTEGGFKAVMIDSEQKAAQLVDTSGSGGFNAFGVEGKFSAAWRKETSYGSRHVTIMLQTWIDWRPQVAAPSSLRLTAEAKKALEKGADRFRKAYGDYFIAGHQRRASFFVIYRLEASSEDSMTEFKAKANVSGYQAFADASLALSSAASEHKLNIDCVRVQEGVSGKGPITVPLKPEQVLKAYESFVERAVGAPSAAILYHYSLVDPDVPCTVDVDPEVLVGVKALFRRLWDCNASLNGIPKAYRAELVDDLNRLRDDIEAHIPRQLSCERATVDRLTADLDDWCARFAEVQMYEQIWARLQKEPRITSGNNSKHGTPYWKCGITGGESAVALAAPLAENVRFPGRFAPAAEVREIYNKRYSVGWHHGWRSWKPAASNPKTRICGYEVVANKGDDGSWSITAGGLTMDNVAFTFGSSFDRGIDWTVRVWGIPAEHLAFDGKGTQPSRRLPRRRTAAKVAARRAPAGKKTARARGTVKTNVKRASNGAARVRAKAA